MPTVSSVDETSSDGSERALERRSSPAATGVDPTTTIATTVKSPTNLRTFTFPLPSRSSRPSSNYRIGILNLVLDIHACRINQTAK